MPPAALPFSLCNFSTPKPLASIIDSSLGNGGNFEFGSEDLEIWRMESGLLRLFDFVWMEKKMDSRKMKDRKGDLMATLPHRDRVQRDWLAF
ncbi:hypothetical protein SDJN03_11623, partial [Cucurbita argyrosperma subsp. sororia]